MAKKLFVKLQSPTIELVVKGTDASGKEASITIGCKRYNLDDLEKQQKLLQEAVADDVLLDKYVKDNVLYILNASVDIYDVNDNTDPVFVESIAVPDTRSVAPVEFFWADSKACLAALLDGYLSSIPWKNSFIEALTKAIINIDMTADRAKN